MCSDLSPDGKINALLSGDAVPFSDGWSRAKDANLRLVWLRALLGDFSIPAMPPHVQICSSYRCNYQCLFCGGHGVSEARHKKLNTQTAMSPDRVKALLREVFPLAYTWTIAASGEFFCQMDLPEILQLAARYKSRASVTTNGSRMLPEILSSFIPAACSLRVSMVSWKKEAYEYFHRNGDFRNVVSNIKTLTRANEMLPPDRRIGVGMVGPILTSTVRELPHRVRVARDLGMDSIASTSFLLQSDILSQSDPRWENERLEPFPGLWNAYREEAGIEAVRVGVSDQLHRAFDGVAPDPSLPIAEEELMFPSIMATESPPTESYFRPDIESAARMIVDGVDRRDCAASAEEESRSYLQPIETLKDVLSKHRADIVRLAESDEEIRVCWRLDLNANVLPGEFWRPCCISPTRFPFSKMASVSDGYNSPEMVRVREGISRGTVPEGCRGCRDLAVVTARTLATEILKTDTLVSKDIYDAADKFTAE